VNYVFLAPHFFSLVSTIVALHFFICSSNFFFI
jgi:hypothetical protein